MTTAKNQQEKQGRAAGGWVCFLLGSVIMCIPAWPFMLCIPLFFAAFALSILAISHRQPIAGTLLLLAILILPPLQWLVLPALKSEMSAKYLALTDWLHRGRGRTAASSSPRPSAVKGEPQTPIVSPPIVSPSEPNDATPTPSVVSPLEQYKKSVIAVIRSRYQYYLKSETASIVPGTAKVTFNIDAEGRPSDIKVVTNTSDDAFGNLCVRSVTDAEITAPSSEVLGAAKDHSIDFVFTFHHNPPLGVPPPVSRIPQVFPKGAQVRLNKETPLLFKDETYRTGEVSETFVVLQHDTTSKRVFILGSNSAGKQVAFNVTDDAVEFAPYDVEKLRATLAPFTEKSDFINAAAIVEAAAVKAPTDSRIQEYRFQILAAKAAYEKVLSAMRDAEGVKKRVAALSKDAWAARNNFLDPNGGFARSQKMRAEAEKLAADSNQENAQATTEWESAKSSLSSVLGKAVGP
jgi:hypothetical protein